MVRLKLIVSGYRNQKVKFLIVFLVTMLTFVVLNISSSFQNSVTHTRLEQLRDFTENAQIVISSADGTYAPFDENKYAGILDNAYIQDYIARMYCYVDTNVSKNPLFLVGMDVSHQSKIFEFSLAEGSINDWHTDDIMISQEYAEQYNLKIGDSINVNYGTITKKVIVKAISKNDGIFENSPEVAVTGKEILSDLTGNRKLVNRIDVTLKELDNMDEVVNDINKQLYGSGLIATAKYDMNYFNAYVTTVTLALRIFSIFLILLSIYILFSLFQSYVYENMEQMATLRSIGFTIAEYRIVLCMQVLIVVLISFLCGLLLTPVVVKLLGEMMFHQNTYVSINIGEIIAKDIVVFLLAFASVYSASYKVSKYSIVDIIKNNVGYKTASLKARNIVATVVIAIIVLGCNWINTRNENLYLHYVALVGIIGFILLIQNSMIRIYGTALKNIFQHRKKALGLYGKQIKTNLISYLTAITTSVFVVTISMTILSISNILNTAMDKMYSGTDLYLTMESRESDKLLEVLDNENRIESYVVQQRETVNIKDNNVTVCGMKTNLSDKAYEMVANDGTKKQFAKLSEKDTVIISDTLAKRLHLQKKDSIEIGGTNFVIVDIVKTFENMGQVMFLSKESFVKVFQEYENCTILINAEEDVDVTILKEDMLESMEKMGDVSIAIMKDIVNENKEANQIIIQALLAFSIIIVVISGIGLSSVVIINIMFRQREFLIFQTIGISKANLIKISFFEAITISIYSVINALVVQKFLLHNIVDILSFYVGNLEVEVNYLNGIILLLLATVITTFILVGVTYKFVLSNHLIEKVKAY